MKSNIFYLNKNSINYGIDIFEDENCNFKIFLEKSSKIIYETFPDIKRGDLVHFNENGEEEEYYRNNDTFIWDGENLLDLDMTIDDYGSIPRSFKVGKDFPVDFWLDQIAHNTITYFEDEIYDKIKDIFVHDKINKNYYCNIEILNKKYKVILSNYDNYHNLIDNLSNENIVNIINSKPFFTQDTVNVLEIVIIPT